MTDVARQLAKDLNSLYDLSASVTNIGLRKLILKQTTKLEKLLAEELDLKDGGSDVRTKD